MTTNWSGRGAIAVCHCNVLWWGEGNSAMVGGKVTTNFGGVDTLGEWTWCHCWVPLQGAIVVCYGWGGG